MAFLPVLLLFLLMDQREAHAQVAVANPLEWAVLVEGNEIIDGQIGNEISGQAKTAALQGTIAAEFTQIKKWEQKYNAYLKSAEGYASSLKAATHLYNDGVRLFINLCEVREAVADNPLGIVATMSMNDLYMETATELVSVFTTLRDAVAAGGDANMLTGAERSATLWMIEDRLKAFNRKLSKLALSLRYYTMTDVWSNMTEGIIDHSNAEIAAQARSRWMRAARIH